MNKKALRKELELILVKTIEGILNIRSVQATNKIKKTTVDTSKVLAKKFYKAVKAIEKTPPPSKINTKKPIKSTVTKAKSKIKK